MRKVLVRGIFDERVQKLVAYSDRNTAAKCNSSLCILCRRNGCTELLWNWPSLPGTDRCYKFYIDVFPRCRIYHRALVPDGRISARRSKHPHHRFSNTRSKSPTRPIRRRFDAVCPQLARIPGSDTTTAKFARVIENQFNGWLTYLFYFYLFFFLERYEYPEDQWTSIIKRENVVLETALFSFSFSSLPVNVIFLIVTTLYLTILFSIVSSRIRNDTTTRRNRELN